MSNKDYLYRGVSEEIHKKGIGFCPKGITFCSPTFYGVARYDSGETYGSSINNAIILHQRDSTEFPTSGISTTPIFERARFYALMGGENKKGFVYKIDRASLINNKVKEYWVQEYTRLPNIPEDDEVILVSGSNSDLDKSIIVEVIEVFA